MTVLPFLMIMLRWVRRLAPIVVCVVAVARAGGAPPIGAGSFVTPSSPWSHAWFVLGASGSETSAVLLHVPPRAWAEGAAGDGSAKVAVVLPFSPEAIAAWERTVFLMGPRQRTSAPGSGLIVRRPVHAITTTPAAVGPTWVYDTLDQNPRSLPSMPGELPLLGVAAQEWGPVALVQDQGVSRLMICGPVRWLSVQLPAGAETARLIAARDGEILIASGEPSSPIWIGSIHRDRINTDQLRVSWREQGCEWPRRAEITADWLLSDEGNVLYARRLRAESRIEFWRLGDRPHLLCAIKDDGRPIAMAPMNDTRRLELLWVSDPGTAASSRDTRSVVSSRTRLAEISAMTGEILYDGEVRLAGALSSNELRLIAFIASGAMLAVLMYAMRPARDRVPLGLPKGSSLALVSRRMAAGAVDGVLCFAVACWMSGSAMGAVLMRLAQGEAWNVPLLAMAVGTVLCTLSEGLWGRTPGKSICGCRVVRVTKERRPGGELEPVAREPGLRRAMIRNTIRWFMPPVAMLGMMTRDWRHLGDRAAGTIVIEVHDA